MTTNFMRTFAVFGGCLAAAAGQTHAGTPSVSGSRAGERVLLGSQQNCGPNCFIATLPLSYTPPFSGRAMLTHVFNPDGGEVGNYLDATPHEDNGNPHSVYSWDSLDGAPGLNGYSEDGLFTSACFRVHFAEAANTTDNWTFIDDPVLNGSPARLVLVQPKAHILASLDETFGVWYNTALARWTIFAENQAHFIDDGATFNYLDDTCAAMDFDPVHVVTPANSNDNYTWLSGVTQRPETLLLVTQLFDTSAPQYNNHPVGVWWDPLLQRWNIYNEDGAAMPVGARFVVAEVLSIFSSSFEEGLEGWSSIVP